MNDEIYEVIEILEDLLDDVSLKAKTEIEVAIKLLKEGSDEPEHLLKVQDQLEVITNISNLDSYTRNEIYNIYSVIERYV